MAVPKAIQNYSFFRIMDARQLIMDARHLKCLVVWEMRDYSFVIGVVEAGTRCRPPDLIDRSSCPSESRSRAIRRGLGKVRRNRRGW